MPWCWMLIGGKDYVDRLSQGVEKAVAEKGFLGAFTGGLTASAGGIAAAIFFGYLAAVLFKPKEKK